jgi:hypothetical protein
MNQEQSTIESIRGNTSPLLYGYDHQAPGFFSIKLAAPHHRMTSIKYMYMGAVGAEVLALSESIMRIEFLRVQFNSVK